VRLPTAFAKFAELMAPVGTLAVGTKLLLVGYRLYELPPGMLYAALYHSFSVGSQTCDPALCVSGGVTGVPSGLSCPSVYAPVSVLPFPWPLFSQLANRIASYQEV